ncbi:MAG: hypothetical protein U1E45_05765 [Geminicoccaceae bacterium]
MTPDPTPRLRLIEVDIQSDESGLLIATSRHLPKLLAVSTSDEDLARDLPHLIDEACHACFGRTFRAIAIGTVAAFGGSCRSERWALLPA